MVGSSGYAVVLVSDTDDPMTMHIAVSDESRVDDGCPAAWSGATMIRFTPSRDSHLAVDATIGGRTIRSNAGYFVSGDSDILCHRVAADLQLEGCKSPRR